MPRGRSASSSISRTVKPPTGGGRMSCFALEGGNQGQPISPPPRARTGSNVALSNLGRLVRFPPAPRDLLLVRRDYTIDGSTIDGSTIDRSTINGRTIRRSTIHGSTVHGPTVHGSTIHGAAILGPIDRSTIHGCTIDRSAIRGCAVNRCTIRECTIHPPTIDRSTISGCTISGRRFTQISGRNVVRCEAGRRNK
jgi:hypothetical protein